MNPMRPERFQPHWQKHNDHGIDHVGVSSGSDTSKEKTPEQAREFITKVLGTVLEKLWERHETKLSLGNLVNRVVHETDHWRDRRDTQEIREVVTTLSADERTHLRLNRFNIEGL